MNRLLSIILTGLIATAAAFSPLEKAEAHHRRCRSYRNGHYGRVHYRRYYHRPVRYRVRKHRPRRYNHYYYRNRHHRPYYYQNHRYRIRRHH